MSLGPISCPTVDFCGSIANGIDLSNSTSGYFTQLTGNKWSAPDKLSEGIDLSSIMSQRILLRCYWRGRNHERRSVRIHFHAWVIGGLVR